MFSFLQFYPYEVRRNFGFDLLAACFFGLFFGGINAFVLVQACRLGATSFEVSVLAALPNAWMLFSPLWAKLWGKDDPFKTVRFFDALGRFFLILLLFNSSINWYLLMFGLWYLFGAVSSTVYGKAMRQAYPVEVRGTLMGWVRVGASLMMIISTGLAGLLLPRWGVHCFFAVSSIFGICSALSFGRIRKVLPEISGETTQKASALNVFRTDSNFRAYMMAIFVFGLSTLTAVPVYTLYQVDNLKVNDGFVSLLALVTSCSSVIFYYIWGRLFDRHSPLDLTVRIFMINLIIPLVYLFTQSSQPLLLAGLVQGIINAGIDLAYLNSVLYFSEGRDISPYMAVHINLLGLRGTIGPLLAPILVQIFSMKGFFALILFLNLLGLWLAIRVFKKSQELEVRNQIKCKV